MKSGIYTITNTVNGKIYVGKAVNIQTRWGQHKVQLRKGNSHCRYLQAAWNKYGEDAFEFEILELHEVEYISSMETWWCNMLNVYNKDYGYNIAIANPHGTNSISSETRKLLSDILKGRKHTEEAKINMSIAHKGKTLSEETKEKLRIINTGKKYSEETKKKHSETFRKILEKRGGVGFTKGRKHTQEWKDNRRKRQTGRIRSVEECKAISEGMKKRKPLTPEQIEKGAAARRGKKQSELHRQRTSENGSRLEVEKYDHQGNFLHCYYSITKAAEDAKVCYSTMLRWAKSKIKPKTSDFIYRIKTKKIMKIESVQNKIGEDWTRILKTFIETEKFDDIFRALKNKTVRGVKVAPKSENVFRAFRECKLQELKVIIAGICPYHTFYKDEPIADGLALSCSTTYKEKGIQPSLENLYTAIENEYNETIDPFMDKSGDLSYLAKQGVLLYNVALTTEKDKPLSHQDIWKEFNKSFWEAINDYTSGICIILLGNEAHKSEQYINPLRHYIFKLSHPASAAYQDTLWSSGGVFKKIDKILMDNNGLKIQWYRQKNSQGKYTIPEEEPDWVQDKPKKVVQNEDEIAGELPWQRKE